MFDRNTTSVTQCVRLRGGNNEEIQSLLGSSGSPKPRQAVLERDAAYPLHGKLLFQV